MEVPRRNSEEEEEEEKKKNPVLVFISNALSTIKPPPNKNTEPPAAEEPIETKPADVQNDRPLVVTFPKQSFTPLKLEAEVEGPDPTTNPLILWQVYAIGGYYILRWAWNKWNEHKGQNRSEDDEPPPTSD